jgi:hypothetical protein
MLMNVKAQVCWQQGAGVSPAAGLNSGQFNRKRNFVPKLIGSRFRVQGSKVTIDGYCTPY